VNSYLNSNNNESALLFLAMSQNLLGNKTNARNSFEKARLAQMKTKSSDRDVIRLRAETAKLLGFPVDAPTPKPAADISVK
jgi:hypothetical protein